MCTGCGARGPMEDALARLDAGEDDPPCLVFVAVGTSLQVQPGAGLAGVAADHGARLIVVNAEPTPYDEIADEVVREPIGTALPELLRGLAAGERAG